MSLSSKDKALEMEQTNLLNSFDILFNILLFKFRIIIVDFPVLDINPSEKASV